MRALGLRSWLLSRCGCCRHSHTAAGDGPSETLRKRLAEMGRNKRKKDPKKDEVFVEVPESLKWLDSASLPMFLVVAGTALFAKVLMMVDDSMSQERVERKINSAPPGQGTVRMLSREEWEEIREVRPRTPFESKLARPRARIRTGESVRLGDMKDWSIDVLTDALTRAEETAKHDQ